VLCFRRFELYVSISGEHGCLRSEGNQCAVFSGPSLLVSEHGSVFPTLVEPVDV